MSASNPTAHIAVSPANDIWRQHERQIRDLYQDKKKTLKEVKEEMEKNGFPKKLLSTWESKLRVDLKIRKKNKASDWKLVYRHLSPRLERPGKKQLKKPTIIRLDGRDIPFDEAWKEIRRSGAHILSPRQLPQGGLPCGIEVRTPSPDLSQHSPTENLASSVALVVPTSSGSPAALRLHASQTVIAGGPRRITSTVSVFSNDLPTTPWVSLCLNLRHVFHDSIPLQLHAAWESLEWWKIIPAGRSLVAQEIENFQSRLDLLPTSSLRIPRPSPDLGHRLVSSRGNISLSDFVSTSIYLLSNRLHDSNDGDRGLYLLCLLFEHDVHVFTQVLQCEQSTGRATWEALVEYSQYHHNKQIFKYLLEIGIRYEWTDRYNFGVLVSALDMDCPTHVVVRILDYLLDSSHISWRDILDAISIALEKRQVEIARLLVRRFDINAELACGRLIRLLPPRSVFLAFILDFDSTCDSNWHALDFFLSNGADVDQFLPSTLFTREPSRDWYNRNEIHRALRPTILDHSFGINRSLFKTLSQHSKVSESTLTKSGLLTSLEEGLDAFRDYLKTRVSATHLLSWRFMREPLEFLLGDHVHHEWRQIKRFGRYFRTYDFSETLKMDLRIIRSLIEYDEDFSSHSIFLPHTHDILDVVLRRLRDQITDDRLQLLSILMHKGADVREEHLESAVAKDGIKVLSWLRPRVKNFPAKAAGALAKAALLNNFEAVEFLLQSGVDPNSYISTRTAKLLKPRRFFIKNVSRGSMEKTYSVQAIAAGVGKRNPSRFDPDMRFNYSSLRMCQVLAEKGAKLVVDPNDNTPFAFTELLFENGSGDTELFAKVKFALSTSKQSKQWESPPAFLLELCFVQLISPKAEEMEERVKIFEYILSEGADVNPGSPLAALVAAGAPKELVERVLSLGAKLNNYTAVTCPGSSWRFDTKTPLQAAASRGNEDLIYLFLEAGADVNSPARGKRGKTALQAICDWSPATEKEHRRKMTICDILLNGGADVNAAPARRDGCTALQYAASSGDLELTAMLIRHGAHVNAPPDFIGCSALDGAASWGRLDVVKLLLDANALSASRISTGYDGSIFMAECSGHHAIACLIRNHLANALGPGSSFVTSSFEEDAEDDHTHDSDSDSGSTENGSSDDEYRRSEYEFSTDDYWNSVDEESSECEAGEDSDHSASQPDSLMCPAPAVGPADAQVVPDLQAVENILTDDFMGYLGTEFDLTADGVNLQWGCELMPGSPTGPLTEILDTQAFPGLQIAADAPTNDWAGYPDTGFVFPEEDMRTQWENESMFPFETLVGMPDDSALWQQVFEMQDQELGFATSDAGLQMSASDQLGRSDPERQDIAEQNCIPELQGDEGTYSGWTKLTSR